MDDCLASLVSVHGPTQYQQTDTAGCADTCWKMLPLQLKLLTLLHLGLQKLPCCKLHRPDLTAHLAARMFGQHAGLHNLLCHRHDAQQQTVAKLCQMAVLKHHAADCWPHADHLQPTRYTSHEPMVNPAVGHIKAAESWRAL
ncbi:hypothetical protein ABBQ32_004503 [Trebouxia sp. C0010 RCD-2024]